MEAQSQSFKCNLEQMEDKVEELQLELNALKVLETQATKERHTRQLKSPDKSPKQPQIYLSISKTSFAKLAKIKRQTSAQKLRSNSVNKCSSKYIGKNLDRGQT